MPKARTAPDEASVPPEFLPIYEAAISGMERWADEVVGAWLERRVASFEWRSDDLYVHLEATTDGRSILCGEVVVTRAHDGFLALVSGKRYRSRHAVWQVQLLESALHRHDVPGVVVRPPFASQWVDAEDLDRWYDGAKIWEALSAEERVARYLAIARDLVSVLTGYGGEGRYNDGYVYAESVHDGGIYCWADCLATLAPAKAEIVLLSDRRYPRGSAKQLLRDTIRLACIDFGVPVRHVRPLAKGYAMSDALVAAWRLNPLGVVGAEPPVPAPRTPRRRDPEPPSSA